MIGILVITGVLALSAFSAISYLPVPDEALGITAPNFRLPQLWNGIYIPAVDVTSKLMGRSTVFVPDMSANGFRKAHMWNNVYIPSMDLTSLVEQPLNLSALELSDGGFRKPHMWNGIYISSMDVTGN